MIDFDGQDGARMVGGRARARSPRQMTRDPEAWPEQTSPDPAAEAVRQIADALTWALADQGLSLRAAAAGSGVNRQAIADLLAGPVLARRGHCRPTGRVHRRAAVAARFHDRSNWDALSRDSRPNPHNGDRT
ncbi:hypothetical protein ACIOC1_31385 [Streptomyces sp. NPDC088197]|uniref:hypothetical protein n=1 Tax=Streptomyces sp. NPDC088197 TaxID=3365840 RepID=UPI0037F8665D